MKLGQYTAWGIEARSSGPMAERSFLIGRYYVPGVIPTHMEGHRFTAFKTRKAAMLGRPKRWGVEGNKHWYVPVKITVTVTR